MISIKKIIAAIVVMLLLIVPFSNMFVFADTPTTYATEENTMFSVGGFLVNKVSSNVFRGNDIISDFDIAFLTFENNERLRIESNLSSNLKYGDIVELRIVLVPKDMGSHLSDSNVTGSLVVGAKSDAVKDFTLRSYRWDDKYQEMQTPKITDVSTTWGIYKKLTFSDKTLGSSYPYYEIEVTYTVTGYGDSYGRYIYLQDFEFKSVDEDTYEDERLSSVISGEIDKVTQNQDKNTDKVIQNQNENTDKILNGNSDLDSSGETGKVDGALGDIDGATQNAMGGKTDEQVQQEVINALDPGRIGLDFNKANRLSKFFDDTMECFGGNYLTLILLSLSLGLAAFLIGRRYSK